MFTIQNINHRARREHRELLSIQKTEFRRQNKSWISIFALTTLCLITILFINSTAQARSRGGDSSSSSDQGSQASAAPAQRSAPAAQVSQRDSRSDSGNRVQRTEVRRQDSGVRIREDARQAAPVQAATQSNSTVDRGNSRSARTEQTVQRSTFSAPSQPTQQYGDSGYLPSVRREAAAQPVGPRIEQQQTAPSMNSDNSVRRSRVASPVARSVEVAARPTQSTVAAPTTQSAERAQAVTRSSNTNSQRLAPTNPIRMAPKNPVDMSPKNPTSMKPDSPQRSAPSTTANSTLDRTQRREKIVRGTAEREVSTPSTGKLMNVERAVSAVDARSNHRPVKNETTVIKNNTTFVNNYNGHGGHPGNDGDRHDGHDGGWWNRGGHSNDNGHHNDHHDYNGHHNNFYVGIGFYGGYSYYGWSPVVYEPAVCTSVAYGPVWPSDYRAIYYGCGPQYAVSYVYPAYHRRYVFMSVGGYWPSYSYARYYWYDCHPWYWYGAEPVAYQVGGGDTNNYYTYNYYGSDTTNTGNVSNTGALTPGTIVNGVEVPDYDALRNAASKQTTIPPQAAQQALPPQQPAAPTESDKLFDAGVTAFGAGDYAAAIAQFQRAVRLEPNDVILPFAYAQALFANTDYEQAAAVLQTALNDMSPAKPEVFFPRGLYKDDTVLTEQIKSLERAVMMNPANSTLQLLYGYQLMGIGKMDDAKVPLGVAKRDARTAGPASTLLNLIDRVKAESQTKK
jgi:Tfp pilus assembly protein PilF